MFTILLIWALAFLPFLNAIPTSPALLHKRACANILQNPSFESGESPWAAMAFGSWAKRGVFTGGGGGQEGRNFYFGQSNATAAHSTLSLSQSGLKISSGTSVDCSAWIASNRPGNVGSTTIEVFVDQVSCGGPTYLGTTGWQKIGGKATVTGDNHTFTIVVISDETGPLGSETWVDNATLGIGC